MTAHHLPLVSVVIPVYNGASFIKDAINSALAQTYPNIEIIVIDDGSTDNTPDILKVYASKKKIVSLAHRGRQNLGVSHTRKVGVDYASGKYIAFLDADDMFLPGKIAVQVKALEQDPEIVLCHSNINLFSETGHYSYSLNNHFNLDRHVYKYLFRQEAYFLQENHICNSTAILRANALKNLSFSFKQLFQFEDWLLWILLADKGHFLYLPTPLTRYRHHSSSASGKSSTFPLINGYAKLELCMAILGRTEDPDLYSLTIKELQATLMYLASGYTDSTEPKTHVNSNNLTNIALDDLIYAAEVKRLIITNLSVNDITQRVPTHRIIKALKAKITKNIQFWFKHKSPPT